MSQDKPRVSRRTLFAGAGAAGAVAAAAALVARAPAPELAQAEPLREPPEKGGGYQLSEHVKRYYKTTLV